MAIQSLTIHIKGLPAPKGSVRGFNRGGRVSIVHGGSKTGQKKLTAWNDAVKQAAKAVAPASYLVGPLSIVMMFRLPRPKSVKRLTPSVKPDLDKLIRSTFDALTGVIFVDDAQIVQVMANKAYAIDGDIGAAVIVSEAA